MSDIISKVIGVLLAFVLLIMVPMTVARMSDDMAMKRLVLNEVSYFIDKVTDKGSVTGTDYEDLVLGVNSHGGSFDVTVVRYAKIAVKDNTGGGDTKSIYCASDDKIGIGTVYLNLGDGVQVRVEQIGKTKGQSLLQSFMRVFEKPFEFTLAGTVR